MPDPGGSRSLFNAATETEASGSSPAGTEWAFGRTADVTPGSYTTFSRAVSGNPTGAIGEVLSLHLTGTDLYYDVVLTDWGSSDDGAPFAWSRTRALVPGCTDARESNHDPRATADHGYCGEWEFFRKVSYADETLAENQFCLGGTGSSVCIARGDSQGPYNAVTETEHSKFSSPEGSTWSPYSCAGSSAEDYVDWGSAIEDLPPYYVGIPMSVTLEDEGTTFDIVHVQWVSQGSGGGFAMVARPCP